MTATSKRPARFVPLVCPTCAGPLDGRLADRVAFCTRCDVAYLCNEGGTPRELSIGTVLWDGAFELALPFWRSGTLAFPAFYGSRLLSLARIVTERLPHWRVETELRDPFPLGSRIDPNCLIEAAPLLAQQAPAVEEVQLLSVPLLRTGPGDRFVIADTSVPLYPEDVTELSALLATPV